MTPRKAEVTAHTERELPASAVIKRTPNRLTLGKHSAIPLGRLYVYREAYDLGLRNRHPADFEMNPEGLPPPRGGGGAPRS